MSTRLLYHGFGIRGYPCLKTAYEGGQVIFTLGQERGDLRGAACGSRRVIRRGGEVRHFRGLPIGARPVQIVLEVPRVSCADCGKVRQVSIAFADARRSYTHACARYVRELSQRMTIRDVAEHLGVGWDLVKDLQHRYRSRKYRRIKRKHVRQIAIDEISSHRLLYERGPPAGLGAAPRRGRPTSAGRWDSPGRKLRDLHADPLCSPPGGPSQRHP